MIDQIREEILHLKQNCKCGATDGGGDDPSGQNKDTRRGSADIAEGADSQAPDDNGMITVLQKPQTQTQTQTQTPRTAADTTDTYLFSL